MSALLIDAGIHAHPAVLGVPRGRARHEAVGDWLLGLMDGQDGEELPGITWKVEHDRSRWDIDPADRDYIYARDEYLCLACGADDDLTIDHVVPKSRGGAHGRENFQTLCRPCNSGKGVQTIDYRRPA